MKPLRYTARPGRLYSFILILLCALVVVLAGLTSNGGSAHAQGTFNPRSTLKQQTSTFSIHIDARQLVYDGFVIPGQSGWLSTRSVQTLSLAPGAYSFQIASGWFADFTFLVTPAGTIDYNHSFDTFLSGRGTSTLVVVGLQVTLDARYLSGAGIEVISYDVIWITYKTVRMVPGSYYQVQQGSGVVASFNFKLGLDGHFVYDSTYDIGNGGFLAGNGTSTLQFLGFPLYVDARDAGGNSINLTTVWNMPVSYTSVQFADLLPAPFFAIQVNTVQTKAIFSIDVKGQLHFDGSLSPYLELDSFHGLTLLKAKGPLPV